MPKAVSKVLQTVCVLLCNTGEGKTTFNADFHTSCQNGQRQSCLCTFQHSDIKTVRLSNVFKYNMGLSVNESISEQILYGEICDLKLTNPVSSLSIKL